MSKTARVQIHLSGAVGDLNSRKTAVKIEQGTLLVVTVPRVTHAGNPSTWRWPTELAQCRAGSNRTPTSTMA
ncbi:MAG: hypothetical protein ACRDRL_26995 [Sciscionella sp.]